MESRDDLILERIREKLVQPRGRVKGEPREESGSILRERARRLAQKPSPQTEGDILEVVAFRLGKEHLAFEAAWVSEVFVPPPIVQVPCTPPFIAGIINMRGSILSVVDLRIVFDLPASQEEAKAALLLSDGEMEFGILAAEVESARTVFQHDIQTPFPSISEKTLPYLRGTLPGAVSLLDARLLLASPQMRIGWGERTN